MKKQKNNKKVKVSVIVATISIILVIGVALLLFLGSKKDSTLPTVIEHKNRKFTWSNKIIRIFAAIIYNI